MLALTDRQIAEYFRRSFTTVDGLWFMKVEESLGFDEALDLDDAVWKILPKIQARMLKAMGNLGDGLDSLRECVTTRLTLDGFAFEIEEDPAKNGLQVRVTDCPWHNLMVKSGREHLSGKVGSRICATEYEVLAGEFGPGISFELGERICHRGGRCRFTFTRASTAGTGNPPF
jgi:hypothetical protein